MPAPVLCTATNETYALGATVVLCSALRHLPADTESVLIYVLDGGVRPATWQRLVRSLTLTGRAHRLVRLAPEMAKFKGLPQDWGSSVMTYARLALPELIDEPFVTYLDADMVVQGDLSPLLRLALGNHVIAAAPVPDGTKLATAGLPVSELGLPPEAPYFQAGFLLINLDAWRAEKVSERVLDYLRAWPRHARHWDQSALNAVLPGRWLRLEGYWNTYAWAAETGEFGSSLDAGILHYVGPHKPWLLGHHRSPSAERFYREVVLTDWGSWRPSALRQAIKQLRYRAGLLLRGRSA